MPFKAPSREYYEDQYILRTTLRPKVFFGYHKLFFKIYKKFPKGTKVLDLGCGQGDFLAILQKKGCDVWGVDINRNNINFIKKYFKLKNVYAMSVDDFFKLPNLPQFDIITSFEVIEHLDNPLEFITNATKLLKKDGTIVFSMPSRDRILINTLLLGDFPPNHLTRWNEKSISNLFGKVEFKVIKVYYTDQLSDLLQSLTSKYWPSFGLVFKITKHSKAPGINQEEKICGGTFLSRMALLGASLKRSILSGIPAIFLMIFGKIFGYKNGHLVIFAKKRI